MATANLQCEASETATSSFSSFPLFSEQVDDNIPGSITPETAAGDIDRETTDYKRKLYEALKVNDVIIIPDFWRIIQQIANLRQTTDLAAENLSESKKSYTVFINDSTTMHQAVKDNLVEVLNAAGKIAHETFTSLKSLTITVEWDPEIENYKTYVLNMVVTAEPDEILDQEDIFWEKMDFRFPAEKTESIVLSHMWE